MTPRPLRLLAFSHSANFGGSEQLLLQLVRELAGDHEVACTVVVPGEGRLAEALRSAGLEAWIWPSRWWCTVGPFDSKAARETLAAGASEVLRGLRDARSFDPDAVLSITTVIPWGGLTAALLGKPHLWYITDFGGRSRFPPEYYLPFEEVRTALREGTDRLFVVSRAVQDRLFADYEVPPPVVPPHLPSPPLGVDRSDRTSSGAPRLAILGNVRRAKGHWDAAAALAELSRRGLEAELVLVGYAEERETEELLEHAGRLGVQHRLQVLGAVHDQLPWIASSDIVLVPSHEETFSLVCLEAHLHAKPLVATRVGGIVEFVHDGVNGLTVPAGDPQALAAAVERLLRDPELARRLGEEGRRQALRRFTSQGFSGRVRRMLEEVVATGRRCAAPAPLLAPLEALAAEHRDLRQVLGEEQRVCKDLRKASQEAEVRLARAQAQRLRITARAARLRRELRAQRRRSRVAESGARELEETLARISSTRGWRLLQMYWRLATRLRE